MEKKDPSYNLFLSFFIQWVFKTNCISCHLNSVIGFKKNDFHKTQMIVYLTSFLGKENLLVWGRN